MVEDTITLDRWYAYEREWKKTPHIDDLAACYLGYYKAKESAEIPMTFDQFKAKFWGGKDRPSGGRKDGV